MFWCTSFFVLLPLLASGAHVDLRSKYPFQRTLFNSQGQTYELYWNYSITAGTIHFAVNVSTTGWVGFGLSPNGQMPGSDVVIGWIAADGSEHFHDRYAETRALPPIDKSQDWFLSSGKEEDGFTILEFYRSLTNCDPRDLAIKAVTERIVWSFSGNDPSDSLGSDAAFHSHQGSLSLNLLGGLSSPTTVPDDLQSFDITVSNITIPSTDTTYWCQSYQFPADIRNATKYVTRVSPVITPHASEFVHHILVHECPSALNGSQIGESGPCHTLSADVQRCTGGLLISGWAVGGEDFIYPENIALPVGGVNAIHHVVIQMHYDNPRMTENTLDSSGMRFYYTSTPREHDAGVMFLGHRVTRYMVIPPRTLNYTVGAVCSANCTSRYLPDGGIHIFANLLHTHLAGQGLELQHLRWNSECQVYEELPPIDFNPNYDFNYQQVTHIPKEVIVLPGDILVLKCNYNTNNKSYVTTGGESTHEEMCLTFPLFYPRLSGDLNLDYCVSFPTTSSFTPFASKYSQSNPQASVLFNQQRLIDGLNAIAWTPEASQDLENSILDGPKAAFCSSTAPEDTGLYEELSGLPEVSCPYQAPDQCNCFEPQPCCERLAAGDNAVEPTGCPATTVTVGAGRATPLSSPYFIVGCSAFLSVIIAAASF